MRVVKGELGRPRFEDVERYLDSIEQERQHIRWLLEDMANIEDCPQTDTEIRGVKRRLRELEDGDD